MWWLACPHHYYEIHVKKVFRVCFGDTTSPDETVYKRLKENWNDVIEKKIDYEDLDLFDWNKWEGTFIADQARSVIVYLKTLLINNTFSREDLKELLNLVLVWLGVNVDKFSFLYPGALSHARFLMQSIYSVKITILSKQLDFYSDVALFVALFHAPWFFLCPLASSAPMLHLNTISQMLCLGVSPSISGTSLLSVFLLLW